MERKYWVKNLFLLLTDIACLLLSLVIAYYFRHRYLALFYKDLLFVLCAFDIILFFVMDPYRDFYQRGYFQEFKKTLSYDLVLMSLTFAYMFIIKPENDYSRFTIFLTFFTYLFRAYPENDFPICKLINQLCAQKSKYVSARQTFSIMRA